MSHLSKTCRKKRSITGSLYEIGSLPKIEPTFTRNCFPTGQCLNLVTLGQTITEQNRIQPVNISAELDHSISFPAARVLHTHKFGHDCNRISLPPAAEYPQCGSSSLSRRVAPLWMFLMACVKCRFLNLKGTNFVSDQSTIKKYFPASSSKL